MKRLTDASFVYTPSFDTDLKRKFRQVEAQRKAQAKIDAANAEEASRKTQPLYPKKTA